jgi:hypothetical protein
MNSSIERVLQQSDRDDNVYESLMAVLAEVPEAFLPEYAEDVLHELVGALIPDVTNTEVVNALNTLASRAIALREVLSGQKH